MTRILLIRHGSTDLMASVLCGRMPGVSLNAEGRRQAEQLGRSLQDAVELQAIYTSPLERARETAEAIARPHNLTVTVEEALVELDFGSWTGKPYSDIHREEGWSGFNQCRSMSAPPGGESMAAVQSRTWNVLNSILRDHDGQTVAVVSHGDVIRMLLLYVLGMPIDHLFRLEIAPCSVSSFSAGIGLGPVVHSVNVTLASI